MVLVQICYTFKQTDASMKTDTCEVPLFDSGVTLIDYRIIAQITIIQYSPSISIHDAVYYTFPIAYINSRAINNNIYPKGCIIVISKNPGSIESSDIYKDTNKPITCRYWYI